MAPVPHSEHLSLCREVYSQLRRIRAHQDFKASAATSDLTINLSVLLGHFERYIKWAERNPKVVAVAVQVPPLRVGGSGA